jgi:hypothetical protein
MAWSGTPWDAQECRAVPSLLQAGVGEGAVVEPAAGDRQQDARAVQDSLSRKVGRGANNLSPGVVRLFLCASVYFISDSPLQETGGVQWLCRPWPGMRTLASRW